MIHLVTDSTADLERDAAQELGVTVVPLTVRFGEEEFTDGVDIKADDFYRRLTISRENPATSQPSPELFAQAYREQLAAPDDVVVSIHISSGLSGTVQSARLAAADFGDRVHVVDSLNVSAGLQLQVREIARRIAAGEDAASVVATAQGLAQRCGLLVLVDTLLYLQRGGRIGKAQAFVGGILKVKPILQLVEGVVHPESRVRSRQQGLDRLVELLGQQGPLAAIAAFHGGAPELLDEMRPRLQSAFPDIEPLSGQIGPVVGAYAGPGAFGICFMKSA